jgi:hypothetical protein
MREEGDVSPGGTECPPLKMWNLLVTSLSIQISTFSTAAGRRYIPLINSIDNLARGSPSVIKMTYGTAPSILYMTFYGLRC